jgi:CDP-glycerol glycerophosphotransferase (TagB/SpsB family)
MEDIVTGLFDADVLLTDESSVGYDFLITGKPIVLVLPEAEHTWDDAEDKHNIRTLAPVFRHWEAEPNDIHRYIAESKEKSAEYEQMAKDVFWYLDGYAADRACKWIEEKIEEMGVDK